MQDGPSTTAGKGGILSFDALAKAKKALQMQKELSEKIKKIPQLNKSVSSISDGIAQSGSKEVHEVPSAGPGVLSTAGSAGAAPTMSTLPCTSWSCKHSQLCCGDRSSCPAETYQGLVNVTKPSNLSTLKVNINKQKQEAFQILKPELDMDPESNPHFDARMGINKTELMRPKRMTFQFVEEGKWSKEAETIKLKKEQKAKQAQLAKAKAAPDINPNLIEITERVVTKEKLKEPIPEIEWWDVPLLVSHKIKMEKITIYLEHPRPIEPPAEAPPPPPQPLMLTKKEMKKLRTQRRLAREKDKREMIKQGLVEPPKPKVKMSNLMKVLGSEATQDPTRLEKEIRSAAAEREQAQTDRNTARKLTPAERREKKERKLFDDPTLEKVVSVNKISDFSHPKTSSKSI
ncbi:U4/U6 small nuclear ribonucleoprotein Prp3 [Quillaja saponaria]|uniref:U4/U6 small nuclear ribonucleoprotein Prp3 n=1 Tax=Quillaja saponaria TaxID=32244 RepID=A0AAD7PCV8_QUISA|nr:U4/U6 small nuclear ribonucleoprotein Prp3 [Quillaja saponaria]